MEKTWVCQFKEGGSITVGTPLLLFCKGEPLERPLRPENLSIKTQPDYSLVLLKSLKAEKNFLSLQVTSYRTGSFEKPFYITDGEQFIKVENLSLQVQSLLTEKDTKAHPAFGPFLIKTPYFLFSIFFISCFLLLSGLFFYRFFKRTHFVKIISKRRESFFPSKAFILRLRQEKESLEDNIINLEKNFKTFLEEQLLAPVENQKIEKVMKNIKKYHPHLYKKSGLRIKQFLKEFSYKNPSGGMEKTYRKLKKMSQELVFLIEEDLK